MDNFIFYEFTKEYIPLYAFCDRKDKKFFGVLCNVMKDVKFILFLYFFWPLILLIKNSSFFFFVNFKKKRKIVKKLNKINKMNQKIHKILRKKKNLAI
jgi:hypothetical protein